MLPRYIADFGVAIKRELPNCNAGTTEIRPCCCDARDRQRQCKMRDATDKHMA